MANRASAFEVSIGDFAARLIAQREVAPRAQITADQCAKMLPGASVVVYIIPDAANPIWTAKATAGDISVAAEVDFHDGTLGQLAETATGFLVTSQEIPRESYAHLDVRRKVVSLAYIPLLTDGLPFGAIELIHHEQSVDQQMLDEVNELAANLAAPALAAALSYESERNSSLHSISRVTQMYDLEKVFNSTLEMDELLPMIAKKFQEMLGAQAVNLWMINPEFPELTTQAGSDPTVDLGAVEKPGEGIAGDVSDDGASVLIADPEDGRLTKRNTGHNDSPIFSILAVALMEHEHLVGVVEAVNRLDSAPFDDDDEFLLTTICETASNALHNASLLQAERKVEILQTLVQVSGEITSTLNMDRVLKAIVNGPSAVIPHERSAIALELRGRLQLKAISGIETVDSDDPHVKRLNGILQWASMLNEDLFVSEKDGEVSATREETKEKFRTYFAESGMRAFYALLLHDEEGRLGVLSFESSDPEFLTDAHLEMIKVLTGQATVALRNASLYQEVPFIGVLEPLLQRKAKFMALPGRRRAAILGMIAAGLIFLAAVPMPMRVDGNAVAAPATRAQVEPELDGVVRAVYVHEGDFVKLGAVVADLDDWEYRDALTGAQAKYQTAMSEANRSLAENDGEQAGIQRVAAQYWAAEVKRLQERLEKTHLRSPISGRVLTAHPENLVGRKLSAGDVFAEIADASVATVDVAIDEADIPLVKPGTAAAVKLESYPQKTFRGKVGVVSLQSEVSDARRVFYARVNVPNRDELMRPGMQGRGKVSVGWRPVGMVLLRRPAMWLYSQLWSWLGW